jgi:hypothetical protein
LYANDGEPQEGVDIFDPFVSDPHRAAQCKLHERDKTIQDAEIRAEVRKARTYDPPIAQYTILTTGKKSKKADDTIKAINRDHRRTGVFAVELLTWDRIEELLDLYPDIRDRLYKTLSAHDLGAIHGQFATVLAKLDAVASGPSPDEIDYALDDSKRALDEYRPDEARRAVDKLLTRYSDRMTPRQRWRANSQMAAARLADGRFEQAGRMMVEAVSLQPADEKARVNEAIGHEMQGDAGRAHELATALRRDVPSSTAALAVCVRTAPSTVTGVELERSVAGVARTDAEVALALAFRFLADDNGPKAEHHARVANSLDPDTPQGHFVLAQVVHHGLCRQLKVADRNAVPRPSSGGPRLPPSGSGTGTSAPPGCSRGPRAGAGASSSASTGSPRPSSGRGSGWPAAGPTREPCSRTRSGCRTGSTGRWRSAG